MPSHEVVISKDYYIGKFEVTQELWEAVMGTNPSKYKGADRPVECVKWAECMVFCNELSRLTGREFRLPTEAEWEFAARGGKKSNSTMYSGSSSVDNVAWYLRNSDGRTHPVGKFFPNELGIYDMNGNVREWCSDWYDKYDSDTQTDPQGPDNGKNHVVRGGGCLSAEKACRVFSRNSMNNSLYSLDLGFRLVLVP